MLAWVDPVADPTGGLEQVGHDRRTYRSLSLTHTHNHPSTDSFATSSDGVGGGIGGGVDGSDGGDGDGGGGGENAETAISGRGSGPARNKKEVYQ